MEIKEAVALADEILDRCEELPERAAEFYESVTVKVSGIKETINRYGKVSDKQRSALENMYGGVERWLER